MRSQKDQYRDFLTKALGRCLWLWVAALLSLAVGPAGAAPTTIVSHDFESYTGAATNLTDTANANPAVPNGVIIDDNPVGGENGSGVQLINWLAHSGTQSLLLRSGTEAQLHLANTRSGSSYTLDFWVYAVRQAASNRGMYVILRGEGSDINGDDYLAYRMDRGTSSSLFCYDGIDGTAAWVNSGVSYTPEVWQHHRFVIDANALTFNFYLGDMTTPVLTGADLARVEIGVPTLIRLVNEGDSADDVYFAIDDISLTVEGATDLATTFIDGFENYPARTALDDDADPKGPWVTTEVEGTGSGKPRAPTKVQVVDSTVVTPHSGTKCLKLEGGQRAGATIAWGTPPQSDVQITWWARVPASIDGTVANYLRMSLYGAENGNCVSGDNALLGYGSRDGTIGDETSLTYYTTAWLDSGVDYMPDVWEQYQLTTHTSAGRYTIIKNPNSANPQVVVDRSILIGSSITNWTPVFMAAWSSSNGSGHPPVYIDDIEIKSLTSTIQPLGQPYTISNFGTRFTNWTVLTANAPVGKAVVDPRDNTTILFTVDVTGGGIYRAQKVASGNWSIDSQAIVAGLDRPSGLAIETNGTIWWTHDYNNDYTRSVARLKAPWASSPVETIISDISYTGAANVDDDAIDLTVAPTSFSGSLGHPGWIVVADRGVDGDNDQALYLIDPTTTELGQTNYNNFLVSPTIDMWGTANFTSIASLPASGKVAVLTLDGTLVAVDAEGAKTLIDTFALWPLGGPALAYGIAADPLSGKIWVTDDVKDEVWSIDSSSGAVQREFGFPLVDPLRTDRQIAFHDPGIAFAPDGSVMVVTDTSTANGGGRLIIFHNEPFGIPSFAITSAARVAQGFQLTWQSAGGARYRVQRGTTLDNLQDITGDLTATQFTDTDNVGNVFYRVVAKP